LKSDPSRIPTAIFLTAAILTSITGFLFPFSKLLPVATFALYGKQLSGVWRPISTVTATLSLYLNVFVLIVQAFLKIPPLKGVGADANRAHVPGCPGIGLREPEANAYHFTWRLPLNAIL
jgi:hypothetical protein